MKERLDQILVAKGLAASREKARRHIMAGEVCVNGQKEDKPGARFDVTAKIELKGKPIPYVSRGGLKLEKAIADFDLVIDGKICMDIGASTGGFTDCMLQNGASKVYSIDVGYGQLDYSLRCDPRVVCMERSNFRYFTENDLPEHSDFAGCDVSFISLKKILVPAYKLLTDSGQMVCLIKPQFEAGRERVGKNGVVRDPKVHKDVITEILSFADETGFFAEDLTFSPVQGPKGNIEYLLYLKKENDEPGSVDAEGTVEEAHAYFSNRSQ